MHDEAQTLAELIGKVLPIWSWETYARKRHLRFMPLNLSGKWEMREDSSATLQLDRIDRRILQRLQRDGRMTNAELAKAANVSPATCHRRTQRLFDDGFIRSVRAEVAPRKVGRGTLVIVGVVLDRSTPESFGAFEAAIVKLPFVLDCHLVAGDFDFFLKIRVRDIDDFNRLHGEELIALPGVRQTRTFFVMKEVADNRSLDF